MMTEWRDKIIKTGCQIEPASLGIVGVGTQAVMAIPFMDGQNAETKKYESRTATNGGVLVTRLQTASEVALHRVLRSSTTVLEVGNNPRHNLIQSIFKRDGILYVNGHKSDATDKFEQMRRESKRKGISRVISHQLDKEMSTIADKLGLQHREDVDIFKKYTSKSGFNKALREQFGGVGTIGPLGITFNNQDEIIREYKRLTQRDVGAIVKFDCSGKGLVMSGTANPLILEVGLSDMEIRKKIDLFVRREHIRELSGEVQMYIPEHVVMSISSGMNSNGEIEMYESHIQTQKDSAADGAIPLRDNIFSRTLLTEAWPHIAALYKRLGMTGGHNTNFLIMPPDKRKIAQSLYGDTLGDIVAIDCNYRPISGTLNAMQRLQEETQTSINVSNFIYKSIGIPKSVGKNLHILFHIAYQCGLYAGPQGNFSLIRAAGFDGDSDELGRVHVIVNGSANMKASQAMMKLELALQDQALIAVLQKKHGLFPIEALTDRDYYSDYLRSQLSI